MRAHDFFAAVSMTTSVDKPVTSSTCSNRHALPRRSRTSARELSVMIGRVLRIPTFRPDLIRP